MLNKTFNIIFGYKIIIYYVDNTTEICRSYLGSDSLVRTHLKKYNHRKVILQSNGVVRGLYPNNETTWVKYDKTSLNKMENNLSKSDSIACGDSRKEIYDDSTWIGAHNEHPYRT